jgi:predicted  nucleic acid-binding Zn-ribbon protein
MWTDLVKEEILREDVILEILAEVRQRIVAQTAGSGAEGSDLEKQATTLRREISNLAEAVAMTGGSVKALAEKLSERQDRLGNLEARIKLLKAAPGVLSLEVRRIEAGLRKRLAGLPEVIERHPEQARAVMASLLAVPSSSRLS